MKTLELNQQQIDFIVALIIRQIDDGSLGGTHAVIAELLLKKLNEA